MNGICYLYILLFQVLSWGILFTSTLDISHKDLESANITCDGQATCTSSFNSKRSRFNYDIDWKDRNCHCDKLCKEYGDCCLDSPFYDINEQRRKTISWKCVDLIHYGGIYMKAICPPSYNNIKIRNLCEKEDGVDGNNNKDGSGGAGGGGGTGGDYYDGTEDPISTLPVTSLKSFYTYKNIYCSICNNDFQDIKYWKTRIECPSFELNNNKNHKSSNNNTENNNTENNNEIEQYVSKNIKYLKQNKSWGIVTSSSTVTSSMTSHSSSTSSNLNNKIYSNTSPSTLSNNKIFSHTSSSSSSTTPSLMTSQSKSGDNKIFHKCNIYPVIPNEIYEHTRKCIPNLIKTCTNKWINHDFRDRCEAYTLVVYAFSNTYRNPDCAICNGIEVNVLHCSKSTFRSITTQDFFYGSFSILFDISGKGNVGFKEQNCNSIKNEIYDPFFKKCRTFYDDVTTNTPDDETNETNNNNIIITNINDTENTLITNTTTIDLTHELFQDNNSKKYRQNNKKLQTFIINEKNDCKKIMLHSNEYVIMDDILYVPKRKKSFNTNEYHLRKNDTVEICLMNYENSNDYIFGFSTKFSPYMGYVTFIGLGLSIIFLLCHLITFILISELRNLSGKNLASLCISLLLGYICFIISSSALLKGIYCFSIGILMQYFFLCSFIWELIISFDIWRTLKLATVELRISNGKQWRKFTVYSLICWLVPGIFVMITVLIDMSAGGFINNEYKPNFGVTSCWFGQRMALLIFFALPLLVIMILNILFFISSAYMIYSTNSLTRFTSSSSTQRDFRLYIRLALIMGLTWSVGLFAGYIDKEPLWYAFIVLNAFQGIYIFLAFTCTHKVIKNLFKSNIGIHSSHSVNHRHNNGNGNIHPASFSCSNTDSSNLSSHSTKKSHIIHSDNHDQLI